jgi:hypothetical protein
VQRYAFFFTNAGFTGRGDELKIEYLKTGYGIMAKFADNFK